MSAMKEMPKYKCHKEVWALKIRDIQPYKDNLTKTLLFPEDPNYDYIEVDSFYMVKHSPQVGGYYVVYEDGYKSYSPAKAFEEGYSLIN
jgi:hypothetical protein